VSLLLVEGSADATAHAARAHRVVGEALQGGLGQVEELLPQQEGLEGTGLHWDLEEGGRVRPLHARRQLLREDAAGGRETARPRVENELRERERVHHGEQLGGRGGLDERRAHFETLLICEQDGVVLVVLAEVLRHLLRLRLAAESHFVVGVVAASAAAAPTAPAHAAQRVEVFDQRRQLLAHRQ